MMSAILSTYWLTYITGFTICFLILICIVSGIVETLRQQLRDQLEECMNESKRFKKMPKDQQKAVREKTLSWADGAKFKFIVFLLIILQSLLWPFLLIEVLAIISMKK